MGKDPKNMAVFTWSARVSTVSKSGSKCFAENTEVIVPSSSREKIYRQFK